MNDNYAVINGKKIELTGEQIKALEFGVRKNPFERVTKAEMYCYIDSFDEVHCAADGADQDDDMSFECSNYFNEKAFAEQVALHQLLYRKLLKYAYENEAEDIEWDGNNKHYYIRYDYNCTSFYVEMTYNRKSVDVFFSNETAAQRAIKEVIEPFMKDHPEFVW